MRKMTVAISILVFLSLLQPVLAQNIAQNLPQYLSSWYSPEALATFLGVPSDWLAIPKVIYYVIVPFIVAVTVTYGILTELNIFRNSMAKNKINILLSTAMAFLLLPSGVLTLIVSYFYLGGEFIGLMAFGFLFIVGIFMWTYGTFYRFRREYIDPANLTREINSINTRVRKMGDRVLRLQAQLNDPNLPPGAQQNIQREINTLAQQAAILQGRRATLQQRLANAGMH